MKNKSLTFLFITALVLMTSGCVNTQYQKSVAVTKDANGKITGMVETETIIQPNQSGYPVKFQYLKDIQP
jgi:ABC-type glycerol-3-phosphate transport system substrate-binding protein